MNFSPSTTMPKLGTMKIGGRKYMKMDETPSRIAGVSLGDMMFAGMGNIEPVDPLDGIRLAYWKALPPKEVKWGARIHGVRIESKKNMAVMLALKKHVPEDPATAPPPSVGIQLVKKTTDASGNVVDKVISRKGEPIADVKKRGGRPQKEIGELLGLPPIPGMASWHQGGLTATMATEKKTKKRMHPY